MNHRSLVRLLVFAATLVCLYACSSSDKEEEARMMESAESFFAKGDSALHNENYNEALKCYFSVLRKTESMEQRGDSLAMKARMAIGAVYSVYGNTTAALRFYRQGLAMARALGDTEAEGKILHNMVQSYCSAGVLDSAYMLSLIHI